MSRPPEGCESTVAATSAEDEDDKDDEEEGDAEEEDDEDDDDDNETAPSSIATSYDDTDADVDTDDANAVAGAGVTDAVSRGAEDDIVAAAGIRMIDDADANAATVASTDGCFSERAMTVGKRESGSPARAFSSGLCCNVDFASIPAPAPAFAFDLRRGGTASACTYVSLTAS